MIVATLPEQTMVYNAVDVELIQQRIAVLFHGVSESYG